MNECEEGSSGLVVDANRVDLYFPGRSQQLQVEGMKMNDGQERQESDEFQMNSSDKEKIRKEMKR